LGIYYRRRRIKLVCDALQAAKRFAARAKELVMKLPLIAASVVAYTMLAVAWIIYAGLTPPNPLF
jgi:hypothetical protein